MSDQEIDAMKSVAEALEPLNEDARNRVITWVLSRFKISSTPPKLRSLQGNLHLKDERDVKKDKLDDEDTLIEISDEKDHIEFHFRDLKAKNQKDAQLRLISLLLYYHEIQFGERETPRSLVTLALSEWRINDSNARMLISNHKGFNVKGSRKNQVMYLDRPGKADAKRYVEEINDDSLIGQWSHGAMSRRKKKKKENS